MLKWRRICKALGFWTMQILYYTMCMWMDSPFATTKVGEGRAQTVSISILRARFVEHGHRCNDDALCLKAGRDSASARQQATEDIVIATRLCAVEQRPSPSKRRLRRLQKYEAYNITPCGVPRECSSNRRIRGRALPGIFVFTI